MDKKRNPRIVAGGLVTLLAVLALAAPFALGQLAHAVLGVLMLGTGVLGIYSGFRTSDQRREASAFLSSAMSILVGLLLLALPKLAVNAQALLLGLSFGVDGFSRIFGAIRTRDKSGWGVLATDGLFSILIGLFIAIQWPVSGIVSIGLSVGMRMLSAGWSMMLGQDAEAVEAQGNAGRLHPDSRLGLPPSDEWARLRAVWNAEMESRSWIDRYWRLTFVAVFFAIHVGRMDVEWNLVGFLSPGVAVAGDVGLAILLAWGLLIPSRLVWRGLTRPVERRAWRWLLRTLPSHGEAVEASAGPRAGLAAWLLRRWLGARYRFAARAQQARGSLTFAMGWGLQLGLPLTAILIALNPIWGMTWYFNTENWATGAWEKWTEYRVDDWRAAMVREVKATHAGTAEADLFRVAPPGVNGQEDFSFIVIGDTGEGDESQHVLRDRFILLGQRPDVRFLVLSSDVIYPSGAMKDYEPKFYLPFKGFDKPIYAVPGNHDWYDALDAFAANFLEPGAARAALRGRRAADHGLTTTTEKRIERMLEQAAWLRNAYGVRTGGQRAPFFEMQTERFALLVVDTGILKTIDDEQNAWLIAALDRSRGKFTMAVLGHPLYAGGRAMGEGDPEFDRLHRLLRERHVDVVMAGDTHYLEYYREEYASSGQPDGSGSEPARTMHHFVNGGGGAYLSIGTPLDWPSRPAVADAAFYPRTDAVVAKLDRETPTWMWPTWFWVKRFKAWPATVESLAPAFDFNRAPFFQSFVEIRVQPSTNSVRLIPHGVDGPLRWRDFQSFGNPRPPDQSEEGVVEFMVPMKEKQP